MKNKIKATEEERMWSLATLSWTTQIFWIKHISHKCFPLPVRVESFKFVHNGKRVVLALTTLSHKKYSRQGYKSVTKQAIAMTMHH